MQVRDLSLPPAVIDHYERSGVEELYPPQVAAVEAGVTDGERVVAAVPTASGKTFVGELAMLTADGPALYIVPLRALAREKYDAFSALPDTAVSLSTGDLDSPPENVASDDVVVATSEKVDSAIRNGAAWVEDLGCVVVDEIHLLGDDARGPTLEVTLATLQRRIPDVQIVGLSATVDNPEEIADWLDANLVTSDWRPVDLRTGVYADGNVQFDDGERRNVTDDVDDPTEATVALVEEVATDGGQCLAFVRSRREAERLAERLAGADFDGRSGADFDGTPGVADRVATVDDTATGTRLADCVRSGVAFHHAGLATEHRTAVETAFRDRDLAVVCATPTLAAGVNLPARRVIVRDQRRYTGAGMTWLPTIEVHQMCGRAGRPGLDPYGEAILIGTSDTRAELRERYLLSGPEAVDSKLADPSALRTHTLSIVATGLATTQEEILDVLGGTFYAHQTSRTALGGGVGDAIAALVDMAMIETDGGLAATDLGGQVSRQYVSPETGARIVDRLGRIDDLDSITELTALAIVCDTPDMTDTYLGNQERADVYQFARSHADEFPWNVDDNVDFEGWLESVKIARVVQEHLRGRTVDEIVDRHRIGPGDLETHLERVDWLLGATEAIAETTGRDGSPFKEIRGRL